MTTLNPEQLKYIMREQYGDGLPIFVSNLCKRKELLEEIVLRIRVRFLSPDPVFWFRPIEDCTRWETAYFIGLKHIHVVEYKPCIPDFETCTFVNYHEKPYIWEEDDEKVFNKLMLDHFRRDLAYIKGLIPLAHPETMATLSEVLRYNRSLGVWEHKFPQISVDSTGLSEQVIYGRRLASASDMLNTFVQMIGRTELPEAMKREIDERLP